MESSKFSISSTAKEKIRRQIMNSRSIKRKKLVGTSSTNTHENFGGNLCWNVNSTEPKVKQECNQTAEPGYNEGVLFVEKDDSIPLITSVYSLADCSGSEPLHHNCTPGGVSSDNVTGQHLSSDESETTIGNQAMTDRCELNDVQTSDVTKLPFVVQCNNGVIMVSSQSHVSSPATITNKITTLQPDPNQISHVTSTASSNFQTTNSFGQTDYAYTVSKSGTSPVLQTNEHHSMNQDSTVYSPKNAYQSPKVSTSATVNQPSIRLKPIHNSEVESHVKLELQPPVVSQPSISKSVDSSLAKRQNSSSNQFEEGASSDHSLHEKSPHNHHDNSTTATISEEHRSSSDGDQSEEFSCPDYPVKEEKEQVSLVTKQDDRIRRLKDLLRQQEEDLERFRFKTKRGKLDSLLPTALAAGERPLRIKLLKKNSGTNLDTAKLLVESDAQSEGVPLKSVGSREFSQTQPVLNKEVQLKSEKEPLESVVDTKILPSTPPTLLKRKDNQQGSPYKPLASLSDGQTVRSSKRKSSATEVKHHRVSDKYRLVNVTVVDGHTRTLVVPVDNRLETGTLSRIQAKEAVVKSVQTVGEGVGTDRQGNEVRVPPVCKPSSATANVFSNATVQPANHLRAPEAKGSACNSPNLRLSQPSYLACSKDSGNHPNKGSMTNSSKNANKNSDIVVTQGITLVTSSPVNSSPTKRVLKTVKLPNPQPLEIQPRVPTVNMSSFPNMIPDSVVTQGSTFILRASPNTSPSKQHFTTLKIPTDTPLINPNKVSSVNTDIFPDKNPSNPVTQSGPPLNVTTLKTSPPEVHPAFLTISTKSAVENISNQLIATTSDACTTKNSSQGLKPAATVVTCANSNNILASRPLHTLVPKLPLALAQENSDGKQNNKLLICSFPKPVIGVPSAAPGVKLNDITSGKILLCNVVQPGVIPKPGEVFFSSANNDKGKVLFYVSDPRAGQKLGMKEGKKIIVSPAPPCLAPNKVEEVTKKSPVESDGNSEFIPNPDDPDFTKLVGLEHVVSSLNSDR